MKKLLLDISEKSGVDGWQIITVMIIIVITLILLQLFKSEEFTQWVEKKLKMDYNKNRK